MVDPEILALRRIARALKPLDVEAVGRVLKWASDRYSADAAKRAGAKLFEELANREEPRR